MPGCKPWPKGYEKIRYLGRKASKTASKPVPRIPGPSIWPCQGLGYIPWIAITLGWHGPKSSGSSAQQQKARAHWPSLTSFLKCNVSSETDCKIFRPGLTWCIFMFFAARPSWVIQYKFLAICSHLLQEQDCFSDTGHVYLFCRSEDVQIRGCFRGSYCNHER